MSFFNLTYSSNCYCLLSVYFIGKYPAEQTETRRHLGAHCFRSYICFILDKKIFHIMRLCASRTAWYFYQHRSFSDVSSELLVFCWYSRL